MSVGCLLSSTLFLAPWVWSLLLSVWKDHWRKLQGWDGPTLSPGRWGSLDLMSLCDSIYYSLILSSWSQLNAPFSSSKSYWGNFQPFSMLFITKQAVIFIKNVNVSALGYTYLSPWEMVERKQDIWSWGLGGAGANGQGKKDLHCHLVVPWSHRGSLLWSLCLASLAACLGSLPV